MGESFSTKANVASLEQFWNRMSFHDMVIEQITAINKRVLIRLSDYTLVVLGVVSLHRCELPADWLYDSITKKGESYVFEVETETGSVKVVGADIRLIRNCDLAVLIPPIDRVQVN